LPAANSCLIERIAGECFMRNWIGIALVVLVLVGITVAWKAATVEEGVPDSIRIRRVLEQGRQEVMDRDIRGAMMLISPDYRDSNGLTYTTLRAAALRALESAEDFTIALDAPNIVVDGARAVARTRVEVVASVGGVRSPSVRFDLTVGLSKKEYRRWGLFRATRWQITYLDGIPLTAFQEL